RPARSKRRSFSASHTSNRSLHASSIVQKTSSDISHSTRCENCSSTRRRPRATLMTRSSASGVRMGDRSSRHLLCCTVTRVRGIISSTRERRRRWARSRICCSGRSVVRRMSALCFSTSAT
ncbi:hypothetical protein LTR28_007588, partial [Elasticomyces elasticus]